MKHRAHDDVTYVGSTLLHGQCPYWALHLMKHCACHDVRHENVRSTM